MSVKALKSGRIKSVLTDSNREFVTLIGGISANGDMVPVALIYQGKSHDLRDTRVDEVEKNEPVYFAASDNGWTNKRLG
jgi:hypothetical protein